MSKTSASPTVERVSHTAASPEGANSTYVLPDRGLVIDPGPPGDASWETLTEGLAAAGVPIESVEAVAVSHWHADHAGLAPRLAEAADAPLVLQEADAPLVGEYADARERRIERDARRLRQWGVPEDVVVALGAADTPSPMPDSCPVAAVTDGDVVAGAEVVHTPGHTAGHLSLAAGDALFLGDAVLPTYTPNVGGTDTRMEAPLSTYLDTLDRLAERVESSDVSDAGGDVSGADGDTSDDADDTTNDADDTSDAGAQSVRAFPGHGPAVDLRGRIEEIRDHHAERVANAVRALPEPDRDRAEASSPSVAPANARRSGGDGGDGRTPWDVAGDLFGEMDGIHAKMGAGEAAAHLSFAVEAGLAERVASEPDRYVRLVSDVVAPLAGRD